MHGGEMMNRYAAMVVVVLAAMLAACTTHTRYYTTGGIRTAEIERTMNFGATNTGDAQ